MHIPAFAPLFAADPAVPLGVGLVLIPILIVINGYFVAAEFALVALRRTRVEELVNQNVPRAKSLLEAVTELDRSVATAQLGITAASLALGFVSEPALGRLIEPLFHNLPDAWVGPIRNVASVLLTLVVITYLHVVFGEQMPKIAALQSPTLARMVSAMNRESINHYAELLFRDGARGPQHTRQGTVANGNHAMHEFFARVGADTSTIYNADGSGLSINDRVTARLMVQLLDYAHHATWGPEFHASLPVAGESGTQRTRMKGSPAQGNLHAKTGTTNDVIALAGYVTATNGEVLAFEMRVPFGAGVYCEQERQVGIVRVQGPLPAQVELLISRYCGEEGIEQVVLLFIE